jgi:nitrite reductase/ring-hydroxylating ferredoxin subunit
MGPVEEFPDGAMRLLKVGRREIGIIRSRERFYALRNLCPHQTGPLCAGIVAAKVVSAGVGVGVAADQDQQVITCPWHGWEFELGTGRCVTDGSMRVATYGVSVAAGRVLVEVSS